MEPSVGHELCRLFPEDESALQKFHRPSEKHRKKDREASRLGFVIVCRHRKEGMEFTEGFLCTRKQELSSCKDDSAGDCYRMENSFSFTKLRWLCVIAVTHASRKSSRKFTFIPYVFVSKSKLLLFCYLVLLCFCLSYLPIHCLTYVLWHPLGSVGIMKELVTIRRHGHSIGLIDSELYGNLRTNGLS